MKKKTLLEKNPNIKVGAIGVFVGDKFHLISDLDVISITDKYPAKVTFKWKGRKRTAVGIQIA